MIYMIIEKFMTKKVITASPEEKLTGVIKKFLRYRISGIPIVKNKKIVGIITENDLTKVFDPYNYGIHSDKSSLFSIILTIAKSKNEFESIKKRFYKSSEIQAKDVMKKRVITIEAKEDVMKAIKIMNKKNINRLPVVKNSEIVGILTRADILKALSE